MATRKLSWDSQVARLAKLSVSKAKKSKCAPVVIFTRSAENIQRLIGRNRRLEYVAAEFFRNEIHESPEEKELMGLRVDLEIVLLKSDACFPRSEGSPEELKVLGEPFAPTDLKRLNDLVEKTARLIGPKNPRVLWGKYQKVDRYFPALKLCKRIRCLLERVPPRPLATLMGPATPELKKKTADFFKKVLKVRQNKIDPAKVPWKDYDEVFMQYQSARYMDAGNTAPSILMLKPGAPTCNEAARAYILFLDLEREDLTWQIRYYKLAWSLFLWVHQVRNPEYLPLVNRFMAGEIDPPSDFREASLMFNRTFANARKAKSRKKLNQTA